ncbi:MAG: hypothetical protein JXR83_20765 [Deltaproteobacteria bacterium]|nr:hypothetical protein [Deltaproteobacteria bacterium]
MLLFESFVHRQRLADIIGRWMVNHPQPGDPRALKTVVNFNFYLSRLWIDNLATSLLRDFHGVEPQAFMLKTKGQLKDFAVAYPSYSTPRIEEMRRKYLQYPEDFYRDTPVDGVYYVKSVDQVPQLIGMHRLKRARRIAEKGARRIVDFMLNRIRANADALADERASKLGIPRAQLRTPQAEMTDEFRHAERRVIKAIKRGTMQAELRKSAIPDVIGMKLIVEDRDQARILDLLRSHPGCRILEVEKHDSEYKALNLKIEYRIPKELLLERPPEGRYLKLLAYRGFDPAAVATDYARFVADAEETISFEVIISTFQNLLESEIGRCMHEERVLSQRANAEYNGNLAANIRHLMNYVLWLCRAPTMEDIGEVPIKLWVKYMPDTIEYLQRRLIVSDEFFFDTVLEPRVMPSDQPQQPPDAK